MQEISKSKGYKQIYFVRYQNILQKRNSTYPRSTPTNTSQTIYRIFGQKLDFLPPHSPKLKHELISQAFGVPLQLWTRLIGSATDVCGSWWFCNRHQNSRCPPESQESRGRIAASCLLVNALPTEQLFLKRFVHEQITYTLNLSLLSYHREHLAQAT